MGKSILFFFLAFTLFLNSACTTRQIIRDSEYKPSENAFRAGNSQEALEQFPNKEKKGFVTSLEQSWISFWADEKNNENLLQQAKTLDSRQYISVLRETEYFFYNESADGYIPAEHEIIMMHLLNAMYFLRNEKWEAAEVETRKATFFVQNYFKEDQSHFDDPALRIWLAGLWAALGKWDEAQVDIRKAYELSKDKSLLPLLELRRAPDEFKIVFSGAGPEVFWTDRDPFPKFANTASAPPYKTNFNTLPWFLRHEKRNSQIRDVVTKSNYMAQYYGLQTSVGAEKSLGFVAANTLRTAGVLAAVAIIAAGVYIVVLAGGGSGSAELLTAAFSGGLVVGGSLYGEGNKVADKFDKSSTKNKKDGLENLRTYRFVRFLPSWISVTDKFVAPDNDTNPSKRFRFQAPGSRGAVLFILTP